MSDIIQLLPDSVANQIAAGEVIQRPASVIKELVENSVDAGATSINVVCVDSGRTTIQVVDNGKGMSETDARLSFERHATSKIRKADDLFNLHTMGFRGEALASIAAVSQVELRTRMADEEVGTLLTIAGSRFVSQEPCSCPVGSNFKIENLFFNVPARRKFLKSNTTELNNIVSAFERIALVYPEIAFSLYNNNNEMYNLRSCGLRQRIVDIFGKKINQHLLPLDVDTSMCRISGFVGKPESARKKGAHQYFFVNGRYMKHPYFHKAVMMAYDRLVPEGEQVPYFIYFNVNADDIDVNIHPTKTEIKFGNEQAIWQILSAAVKDAVGMFNDVTAIEFDTEGQPDIPAVGGLGGVTAPKVQYNPEYNPFKESAPKKSTAPSDWDKLYAGLDDTSRQPRQTSFLPDDSEIVPSRNFNSDDAEMTIPSRGFGDADAIPSRGFGDADVLPSDGLGDMDEPATDEIVQSRTLPSDAEPQSAATDEGLMAEKSPDHYQFKGKYIMTAVKSGLMIIDQRRAHIRILYERYLAQMADHHSYPQKLMFPEALHLTPANGNVLASVMTEMQSLGFELSDLGGNTYAVNAVPSGLEGVNCINLLQDLIASARDVSSSSAASVDATLVSNVNHELALGMARGAAIGYGEVLNNEEMETIINSLFACSNCNYTPDGKKILAVYRQTDMEQLLG
ncbi:MAG: DNA mismatch repair endonuclease MutL [Bacteroidales bacterium]